MFKHQSKIDSLCFPETLNKMIVINAPSFFPTIWNLIKRWVDPRTTDKIEIYSSRSKWEKRLKELVHDDQLLSDYGGTGPSFDEVSLSRNEDEMVIREEMELIRIKSSSVKRIVLNHEERLDLITYKKAAVGADILVSREEKSQNIIAIAEVQSASLSESLQETKSHAKHIVARNIKGPGIIHIKVQPIERNTSSHDYLLLVGNVKRRYSIFSGVF